MSSDGARNELELYICLHSNYWRKGYGYEIMSTLIDHANQHMPELNIIIYIQPKNEASLKLTEKLMAKKSVLGLSVHKEDVLYDDVSHILYRYTRGTESK